jgi:hypothetical protein
MGQTQRPARSFYSPTPTTPVSQLNSSPARAPTPLPQLNWHCFKKKKNAMNKRIESAYKLERTATGKIYSSLWQS